MAEEIFSFKIHAEAKSSSARCGVIKTDHGDIQTPIFMPVGTAATVKTLDNRELTDIVLAEIILANTYHLYLRPGMEVISNAGGLHKFMNWDLPLLTDSGGYQVYSLSKNRKLKDEGVTFASHIDGSKHLFTPENVVEIQRTIGSDFMMVLDECTPYPCEYGYAKNSLKLTHRWLLRCIKHFNSTENLYGHQQCLIPIVQGSVYTDLRQESARFIADQDLPINAIGGLSVGEPEEELHDMTSVVCEILPKEKPRYLMGVGTPWNLLNCIARGIDMFDCVLPTRNGRHGLIYTPNGVINARNAKWKDDHTALDLESSSPLSRNHSKAYVRHLVHSGEILGSKICSLHNICFFLTLMRETRTQIAAGTFDEWHNKMDKQLRTRL